MKYGALFLVFGGVLGYYGLVSGGWSALLLWPALSLLLVSGAYLGLGANVFGKRPDGRLAWYAVLPLLPFLLGTWGVWHLSRWLRREDRYNEIVPGIYVGRRVLPGELPPRVKTIVDLTAEFPEPANVRRGRRYLCMPTLDASVPADAVLKNFLDAVVRSPGPVYIHCAEGHGRSGMFAAALLCAKGEAKDVGEAIKLLARARPGVRLNRQQRDGVSRVSRDSR
jgi:protein-tyrosine phosphatase